MVNISAFKESRLINDVSLAKTKDKEAFERLINNNKHKLFRIAKSILKSDFDVDDSLQETIIKAWTKIDTLKDDRSFSTWITKILVNECYLIIRKRRSTLDVESFNFEAKDSSIDIDNKIDVWNSLNSLTDDFRLPIILYFFEDFSYEEISVILKIPKGTVRSRISRGKEKLESILNNYSRGDKHE